MIASEKVDQFYAMIQKKWYEKSDPDYVLIISPNHFYPDEKTPQTFSSLSKKDDYVVHMRVYNEATTLREQVENVINYGYRKILLINDGSRDNSANIIQDLQKEHQDCLILCCTHTINR